MDTPGAVPDDTNEALTVLMARQKPSRSWLWAPLLVVGLSFLATATILVVEHLRRRPVPAFATIELIEARYAPQLARLSELTVRYLDGGYGSEFFEKTELFSAEGIEQAAIHTGPDRITIVGKSTITSSSGYSPPRPDAKVGHPVLYMGAYDWQVIYRAKVENADGEEGWYSLTLNTETLRTMAQGPSLGAGSVDNEEPR